MKSLAGRRLRHHDAVFLPGGRRKDRAGVGVGRHRRARTGASRGTHARPAVSALAATVLLGVIPARAEITGTRIAREETVSAGRPALRVALGELVDAGAGGDDNGADVPTGHPAPNYILPTREVCHEEVSVVVYRSSFPVRRVVRRAPGPGRRHAAQGDRQPHGPATRPAAADLGLGRSRRRGHGEARRGDRHRQGRRPGQLEGGAPGREGRRQGPRA